MGYAFISYSSINQASADAMREMFNRHNIHTWMAPYDIPAGSSYMGEINRALLGCDCLVLMLSEAAQNSQWVLKELERAVSYKKTIIPIKIEDIVLNDDFDFVLGSCHVVAVRKIDENSDEVKNVLNSVIACTREKNKTIDKKTTNENVIVETDIQIESENKPTVASLNKSQRKELMSYKCFYCGMHAEVLADTDGYYAECIHCGAVGTIADTIDAAITNWKLCMTDDDEYSGPKLYRSKTDSSPSFELDMISLFQTLWIQLYRRLLPSFQAAEETADADLLAQRQMVSYIYQNYSTAITLEDIAASGKVCRSKCCQIFKKYMGQSPMDFVNSYRLECSQQLLERTSLSITDICLACGFNHQSYFTKQFRLKYQCTPKEYRKT